MKYKCKSENGVLFVAPYQGGALISETIDYFGLVAGNLGCHTLIFQGVTYVIDTDNAPVDVEEFYAIPYIYTTGLPHGEEFETPYMDEEEYMKHMKFITELDMFVPKHFVKEIRETKGKCVTQLNAPCIRDKAGYWYTAIPCQFPISCFENVAVSYDRGVPVLTPLCDWTDTLFNRILEEKFGAFLTPIIACSKLNVQLNPAEGHEGFYLISA